MSTIDNISTGFVAGVQHRFEWQTASHGRWGEKLGRDSGSSLEFMDYRSYQPGDDLRHIDWNAYGRTDRLTVKRFESEVQPHVDILLDTSCSMAVTEQKQSLTEYWAGYIMGAAEGSRYSHQLWWLCNNVFIKATYQQLISSQSAELKFDSVTSLGKTLLENSPNWNSRTFKVILSDFLWEEDPFVITRRLSANSTQSTYIQVLGRQDVHPEFSGDVKLTDSESGVFDFRRVDTGLIKIYEQNLRRHQQQWESACRAVGANWKMAIDFSVSEKQYIEHNQIQSNIKK